MAYQAGLRLDKFWKASMEAPPEEEKSPPAPTQTGASSAHPRSPNTCRARFGSGVLQVGDVWLRKILEWSDEDFVSIRQQWDQHMKSLLALPEAQECFDLLVRMVEERRSAIDRYGYLSKTTESDKEQEIESK